MFTEKKITLNVFKNNFLMVILIHVSIILFLFIVLIVSFIPVALYRLLPYDDVYISGLTEAAAALQREANLPRCATPPNVLPTQPCVFSSPHLASPRIVSY